MDPFSALIMAGGSLLGGFMNTSSAQAINSANLQQSMYMANNAVSMRVADAKRAGINPLAALGVSTPGFAAQTPTDPGQGLMQMGKAVAGQAMDFDHLAKLKEQELKKNQSDIERVNMATSVDYLQGVKVQQAIDYINNHPEVMPEGVNYNMMHEAGQGGSVLARWFWQHGLGNANTPPESYNTP